MTPSGALHTLHPGDVVCGQRGDKLQTLLGSCVAIVLTDPRRTVGAMCHVVHTSQSSQAMPTGACGEVALAMMFKLLRVRGIDPLQCMAFVVGGGNMFPNQVNVYHVGERNSRWALAQLAQYGIEVVSHDIGGFAYRRLSWTVGPGEPQVTAVPV